MIYIYTNTRVTQQNFIFVWYQMNTSVYTCQNLYTIFRSILNCSCVGFAIDVPSRDSFGLVLIYSLDNKVFHMFPNVSSKNGTHKN